MKRLSSCRSGEMGRTLSVSVSLASGSLCEDERSARGRRSQESSIAKESGSGNLLVPVVSAFVLAPPYETGDTGNSGAAGCAFNEMNTSDVVARHLACLVVSY